MKKLILSILLLSILLLLASTSYADNTSLYGIRWNLNDSTVSPPKDVTEVDLSGVTVTGVASSTSFDNHTGDTLAHGGGSSASPIRIRFHDEKPSGTAGGTFTSGAWRTRDLNTIDLDSGAGAFINLSSTTSQIIFREAETWDVEIIAPAFGVSRHRARWYSFTNDTTVALGTTAFQGVSPGDQVIGTSILKTRFTPTLNEVFEVQHRSSTSQATSGFGVESVLGTELYTVIDFKKVTE